MPEKEFFINQNKFISVKRAAQITKYATDYIGQLCRLGKIEAKMIGRSWYVSEKSILSYKELAPLPGGYAKKNNGENPSTKYLANSSEEAKTIKGDSPYPKIEISEAGQNLLKEKKIDNKEIFSKESILPRLSKKQIHYSGINISDFKKSPKIFLPKTISFISATLLIFGLINFLGYDLNENFEKLSKNFSNSFLKNDKNYLKENSSSDLLANVGESVSDFGEKISYGSKILISGVLGGVEVLNDKSRSLVKGWLDLEEQKSGGKVFTTKEENNLISVNNSSFETKALPINSVEPIKVIEQKIVERIIERPVEIFSPQSFGFDQVVLAIQKSENSLKSEIYRLTNQSASDNRAVYSVVSMSNRIDNLSGVSISGATIQTSSFSGTSVSATSISGTTGSFSSTLSLNGIAYTFPAADGSNGQVLTTNGSGTLSWTSSAGSSQWTTSGSAIYYSSGNVGIGTTTPNWSLQVASNTPYLALTDADAGANQKHWLLSSLNGVFQIGTSTDSLSATSSLFSIGLTGDVSVTRLLNVNGTAGTSTFASGIEATYLNITGTSATSTFARGINLSGGCFSINNTCLSTGGNVSSVANSDSTLTISPTTGSVVASLNLTNPNTWTALQQFQGQASTTRLSVYNNAYFGATATSTFDSAGNLTLVGNLIIGGDTINELAGTGLTVSSNALTTTLGTAIDTSEITNGTIVAGDLNLTDITLSDFTNDASFITTSGANTFTSLQQFQGQASTTRLSVYDLIYVGSTATTTISQSAVNLPSSGVYQINGTTVLSNNTLGTGILTSSLTTVGTLNSGSITSGFGSIDIGADGLTAGATSLTSLSVSGNTTLTLATSTSATSTNALFGSNLTANLASFGQTATSTFSSSGALTLNIAGSGSLVFGNNGVTLSDDGDGALRLLGSGTGADEDLTLNFDDTTDQVVITSSTGVATTTFNGIGLSATYLNLTGTSATSTFARGINLSGGCFAVSDVCTGAVSSGLGGYLGYYPSAGTTIDDQSLLYFSSSGSGNLGIGTTTPNWTLQVASSTPYLALTDNDAGTNKKHWLLSSLNGIFQIGTSSDALSATTSLFAIADSGKVGIGTSSPISALSVVGDVRIKTTTNSATALVVENSVASSTFSVSTVDSTDNLVSFATSTGESYFEITAAGNVGIGTTTPGAKLNVIGALCVDDSTPTCGNSARTSGTIYAVATAITGIDLAERYPTKDQTLLAGELVALDKTNPVFVKRASKDDQIIGVVSTAPGVLLGGYEEALFPTEIQVPVALSGRVPVKVKLSGGIIEIGDRISVSIKDGFGQKAKDYEASVGIALQNFDGNSVEGAEGEILVFVNLDKANLKLEENEGEGFWIRDLSTGYLKLAGSDVLDLNGGEIKNVRAIFSAGGEWSISPQGNLVVESIHVRSKATIGTEMSPAGITLFDEITNLPYCLSIASGLPKTTSGPCQKIEKPNTSDENLNDSPEENGGENEPTPPAEDQEIVLPPTGETGQAEGSSEEIIIETSSENNLPEDEASSRPSENREESLISKPEDLALEQINNESAP